MRISVMEVYGGRLFASPEGGCNYVPDFKLRNT